MTSTPALSSQIWQWRVNEHLQKTTKQKTIFYCSLSCSFFASVGSKFGEKIWNFLVELYFKVFVKN